MVENSDSDEYVASIDIKERMCVVEDQQQRNKLCATMLLNGHKVLFQLDDGATVNNLPEETYKDIYGEDSIALLDKAEVTLLVYNKTEEKPLGKKRVRIVNPKNWGLRASEQMKLISVIKPNILAVQVQPERDKSNGPTLLTQEHLMEVFADVFSGEGKLQGDLH